MRWYQISIGIGYYASLGIGIGFGKEKLVSENL